MDYVAVHPDQWRKYGGLSHRYHPFAEPDRIAAQVINDQNCDRNRAVPKAHELQAAGAIEWQYVGLQSMAKKKLHACKSLCLSEWSGQRESNPHQELGRLV